MMFPTIMLAASLAAGSPIASGNAQVAISYADLDLSTETGRQTLERRIAAGVVRVCGDRRAAPLADRRAIRRCHSAAMHDASGKVEVAVARTRMNRQIAQASFAAKDPR